MIVYNDTVTLVTTTVDIYGSETVDEQYEVPAVVELGVGFTHADNQDAITSDAIVRVDPTNSDVQDNFYRLEGMMVIIDTFGSGNSLNWYRVADVTVYRDTQLSNQIDNIQLTLEKTTHVS